MIDKVTTKLVRKGPSQSEMLKDMLANSKETLKDHKKSGLAVAGALNSGFKTRITGQKSMNSAKTEYNKAVDAANSLTDSANRLTKAANSMSKSAIATRELKRKMTNIVRQFALDSNHTGVAINDLQKRIGGYIKNNTADILEVIQHERQTSFDSLASVKLRKGIKGTFDKFGIPINRFTTIGTSFLSGVFGYQLGKRI